MGAIKSENCENTTLWLQRPVSGGLSADSVKQMTSMFLTVSLMLVLLNAWGVSCATQTQHLFQRTQGVSVTIHHTVQVQYKSQEKNTHHKRLVWRNRLVFQDITELFLPVVCFHWFGHSRCSSSVHYSGTSDLIPVKKICE